MLLKNEFFEMICLKFVKEHKRRKEEQRGDKKRKERKRQDKTRQDKTRQDKTRQDRTKRVKKVCAPSAPHTEREE